MDELRYTFVYGYGDRIEDALKKAVTNIAAQVPSNQYIVNQDLQSLVKDNEWCAVLKVSSRNKE